MFLPISADNMIYNFLNAHNQIQPSVINQSINQSVFISSSVPIKQAVKNFKKYKNKKK